MRSRFRLAFALASIVLGACERVVSVEVPNGPTRLVVEARIERVLGAVTGAQRFRLTTTSPYFSTSAPPPARGAIVRVTDETGVVTTFGESSPGIYTTSTLTGVTGRRYTLAIDWNGQRYEATETLATVAPIDSIYFAPRSPLGAGPKDGMRATIELRDPRLVPNWYLWEQFIDGARLLGPDSSSRSPIIASDDGIDGRKVRTFQPFDGFPVAPGSAVLVRQVGLSEAGYRYYLRLAEQTANDGSPFAVPSASVRGNIANRTDPTNVALGYFQAGEVSEARATLAR